MPPKKAQPVESDADTDHKLDAFMAQLASMNRRLNKVDLLSEQLGNIKESMRNLTAENSLIKSTIASTQTTLHTILFKATRSRWTNIIAREAFGLWSCPHTRWRSQPIPPGGSGVWESLLPYPQRLPRQRYNSEDIQLCAAAWAHTYTPRPQARSHKANHLQVLKLWLSCCVFLLEKGVYHPCHPWQKASLCPPLLRRSLGGHIQENERDAGQPQGPHLLVHQRNA